MAHLWNKISLVSAIALAGVGCFFAGCNQEMLRDTYQDIYQRINNPGSEDNVCVCTYIANGKNKTENYKVPNDEYGCSSLQSYLKKEKRYDGVSCQPAK